MPKVRMSARARTYLTTETRYLRDRNRAAAAAPNGYTWGIIMQNNLLLSLAAKYVWWNPPETVVTNQLDKLTANVMEMGTWEDANALLAEIGPDRFLAILKSPPPGGISSKSLAFWHHRFALPGAPPRASKRAFQ